MNKVCAIVGLIVITSLTLAMYNTGKAKCAEYGQSYKLKVPDLDGVCIAYLVDGTEVETPIEFVHRMKYNPHTGEKGWRNEP
jgi:hypothetical protein